ncbi:fibronectin type III domain-containing protein [Nocardioides caldifontis]|uniref:fibronectin type III domain-containing protein n=1 Tax=Nocardioides caldifontis TaxID=2588938 RepID=UPI0011DF7FEB|nr:glycosyl hydrolase [Nocardioides caldifontis]
MLGRARKMGVGAIALLAGLAGMTLAGAPAAPAAPLPGCELTELLVNPCRPMFGASSNGTPDVDGTKRDQILNFEQRVGRQLDIVHLYHGAGNMSHQLDEHDLYFINRPDTLLYLNWPVTTTSFASAAGGNAQMNGYIRQMARSIKALGDKKLFLAVHHEPENDIAFTCPGQSTRPGTMGTAAEYVAMWHNIRSIFDAEGVDNVVWVMNYMNYPAYECMIDDLWPGDEYVDWITFNGYQGGNNDVSFEKRVREMYDVLLRESNQEHDYASKEWGIVEWSIHSASRANTYLYYQQARQAVENNVFPKLNFYMVFDNQDANRGIRSFMVAYDSQNVFDPAEQEAFNVFANSWRLSEDGQPGDDDTAPTTPGGFTATVQPSGTVQMSWSAASDDKGVARYELFRNGMPIGSTASTSFTDTIPSSARRMYTVRAVDTAGQVSPTTHPTIATAGGGGGGDTTAPSVPTGVAATRVGGQPVISWNASTDNVGVTGYDVLRNGTVVGTTTGTSWTDTSNPAGTPSYTVRARDAAGNVSAASTAVSPPSTADTTRPSRPTGVTSALVNNQPRISWTASTDNVGVTGYDVLRNGVVVGTTTTTSYTDAAAPQGRSHTWTVRARDAAGNVSQLSASVSRTVPDTTAPSAPGSLTATRPVPTRVRLTWTAATDNVGVTGYIVYRGTTVVARPGSSARSYTVTGLPRTAQTFRVAARDARGNIGPSLTVTR